MSLSFIYSLIPGAFVVVIFCYSFMMFLSKIKWINKNKYATHYQVILPPLLGAIMSNLLTELYPVGLSVMLKTIIGLLCGFNLGYIVAWIRRFITNWNVSKDKGLPTILQTTVSLIENPVDNATGKTLAPHKNNSDLKKNL